MKLVYAIVHDEDSERATRKLNEKKFSVTKLSSTGGFLKRGNTTLMIGTEDEKVPEVIEIVKEECAKRQQIEVQAPYMGSGAPVSNYSFVPITVEAGGATIFVINVEEFHKVKRMCQGTFFLYLTILQQIYIIDENRYTFLKMQSDACR